MIVKRLGSGSVFLSMLIGPVLLNFCVLVKFP